MLTRAGRKNFRMHVPRAVCTYVRGLRPPHGGHKLLKVSAGFKLAIHRWCDCDSSVVGFLRWDLLAVTQCAKELLKMITLSSLLFFFFFERHGLLKISIIHSKAGTPRNR